LGGKERNSNWTVDTWKFVLLEDFRDLTSVLNIYYSFFNVIKGNRNTVIAQVKLFEDETILPTNQKERKKG